MLGRIISILLPINTLLGFAAVFIAGYHQTMFVDEWLEDHAKSAGFFRRQRLSVTAIFSPSFTERCRRRRRQVGIWTAFFFALLLVQGLLLWVARSL
jgi:hypothetical protein